MIAEAHAWVRAALATLTTAIEGKRVSTDEADLAGHWAKVRPCALLTVGRQRMQRSGTRVARVSETASARTYRRRVYRRQLPLTVLLLAKTEAQAEELLVELLTALGNGYHDAGENHVRLLDVETGWEGERSRLRMEHAAAVTLHLRGGVYRDETVGRVDQVTLTEELQEPGTVLQ